MFKIQKRKARDTETLKQGKLNKKVYKRGLDHNMAFLVPVLMYYGYGIPGACCTGIAGVRVISLLTVLALEGW